MAQLIWEPVYSTRPANWDAVVPGMARGLVYRMLGDPTIEAHDWKEHGIWSRRALLNERSLVVTFATNGPVESSTSRHHWRVALE